MEQLKVNIDDENFSTSTSILEYLVKREEINPKSLAVSQEQGRGKLIWSFFMILSGLLSYKDTYLQKSKFFDVC